MVKRDKFESLEEEDDELTLSQKILSSIGLKIPKGVQRVELSLDYLRDLQTLEIVERNDDAYTEGFWHKKDYGKVPTSFINYDQLEQITDDDLLRAPSITERKSALKFSLDSNQGPLLLEENPEVVNFGNLKPLLELEESELSLTDDKDVSQFPDTLMQLNPLNAEDPLLFAEENSDGDEWGSSGFKLLDPFVPLSDPQDNLREDDTLFSSSGEVWNADLVVGEQLFIPPHKEDDNADSLEDTDLILQNRGDSVNEESPLLEEELILEEEILEDALILEEEEILEDVLILEDEEEEIFGEWEDTLEEDILEEEILEEDILEEDTLEEDELTSTMPNDPIIIAGLDMELLHAGLQASAAYESTLNLSLSGGDLLLTDPDVQMIENTDNKLTVESNLSLTDGSLIQDASGLVEELVLEDNLSIYTDLEPISLRLQGDQQTSEDLREPLLISDPDEERIVLGSNVSEDSLKVSNELNLGKTFNLEDLKLLHKPDNNVVVRSSLLTLDDTSNNKRSSANDSEMILKINDERKLVENSKSASEALKHLGA